MGEIDSAPNYSLKVLERRLGPVDETQIRLLLQVPPARRLQTMLEM